MHYLRSYFNYALPKLPKKILIKKWNQVAKRKM